MDFIPRSSGIRMDQQGGSNLIKGLAALTITLGAAYLAFHDAPIWSDQGFDATLTYDILQAGWYLTRDAGNALHRLLESGTQYNLNGIDYIL